MKKYGLKIKPLPETAYRLGAVSHLPFKALQHGGDWTKFLPEEERQNSYNQETYACVVYTILNCIEILIKRKYREEINLAERFLATLLETGKNYGSDPHEACDLLRHKGSPLQEYMPVNESTDFFSPIAENIFNIALKLITDYDIKYQFIINPTKEKLAEALEVSPILVAVPAWYKNEKGIYYRHLGIPDNHATTLINYKLISADEMHGQVFDSYGDQNDPFIKTIDLSMVKYAIMFHVEKKPNKLKPQTISLWKRILHFLTGVWYI